MSEIEPNNQPEHLFAGRVPEAAATAWPEAYADASRAIAAEAATDPHDPRLYWSFFPGTD